MATANGQLTWALKDWYFRGIQDAIQNRSELGSTIHVDLGTTGFDIVPDRPQAFAGTYDFTITDVGYGHELLLIQTDDTAADIIAAADEGGTFDEGPYEEFILIDEEVAHGDTTTVTDVELTEGHYVMVCNEEGHAHLGMAIDFNVVAAPDNLDFDTDAYQEAFTFGEYFRPFLGGLTTTI
jgi:hypothetical protein